VENAGQILRSTEFECSDGYPFEQLLLTIFSPVTVMWPCSAEPPTPCSLAFSLASSFAP
jgi:hypothetical protein